MTTGMCIDMTKKLITNCIGALTKEEEIPETSSRPKPEEAPKQLSKKAQAKADKKAQIKQAQKEKI